MTSTMVRSKHSTVNETNKLDGSDGAHVYGIPGVSQNQYLDRVVGEWKKHHVCHRAAEITPLVIPVHVIRIAGIVASLVAVRMLNILGDLLDVVIRGGVIGEVVRRR